MEHNREELFEQLEILTEFSFGSWFKRIALLANVGSFVMMHMEGLNWVGFYLVEDRHLILGPFQGNIACQAIAWNTGVCGTAWATSTTQVVPNVHEFPGHIACDSNSNSEVVIPIKIDNKIVAVFDIDSDRFNRFLPEDVAWLERVASLVETKW